MSYATAVSEAIDAKNNGVYSSLRAAALAKGAVPSTVYNRVNGLPTRQRGHESQQLLSIEQEQRLIRWILDLERFGQAPNHAQVRAMIGVISSLSGGPSTVGKGFISRFVKRHPEVQSKIGIVLDRKRCREVSEELVREWYNWLFDVMAYFDIDRSRTWNMDEMGTALAVCGNQQVLGSSISKRATVSLPADREWCTIIECINADSLVVQPLLIFRGKTVQQQWFIPEDVPDWVYTSSKAGYTTDEIGLEWLTKIFIPETTHLIENNEWRLLILDGQNSHITPEFIATALANNIWCHYLVPHASHILQPLDLTVFSPLKRNFRALVAEFWQIGAMDPLRKQQFIERLRIARTESLTRRNCGSGFKAAGIWPFDASKGMNSPFLIPERPPLRTPTPPPATASEVFPNVMETPRNSHAVRAQLRDLVRRSPSDRTYRYRIQKIMNAYEARDVELAQLLMDNRTLKLHNQRLTKARKTKQPVNPNQLFINAADIEIGSHRPEEVEQTTQQPKKAYKEATKSSKSTSHSNYSASRFIYDCHSYVGGTT